MTRLPAPVNPLSFAHVTEAQWLKTVTEICHTRGYITYHAKRPRRDPPGFPDLVIVGPANATVKRVIFAELKTIAGKVEPGQQIWLDYLAAARQNVYVWRPGDTQEIFNALC